MNLNKRREIKSTKKCLFKWGRPFSKEKALLKLIINHALYAY